MLTKLASCTLDDKKNFYSNLDIAAKNLNTVDKYR